MELLRRALGSFPDAAWIRRQFTLDADAVHDVGHALRILLETPGFTLIALLVFALGIGAATAMVSVADAFFVRRLPVPQPERVMTVRGTGFWNVPGRLRPGVSTAQARAEFDAVSASLRRGIRRPTRTSPRRSCRCASI